MFVFDHIPKTAGTTLKFILRNNFGMHHCDANLSKKNPFTHKDLKIARRIFPGIKSISGHNLNINYKKKIVAKDNSIKNKIMKDPNKLALAKNTFSLIWNYIPG